MADKRRNNKRRGKKQTYVARDNAVHITLYSPSGDALPPDIIKKAEESILQVALDHRLLIGVATT